MSNLKLFEYCLETRDGEHEYDRHYFVAAETIEQAELWVEEELADWYGDETEIDKNGVAWPRSHTVATGLDWIQEKPQFIVQSVHRKTVEFSVKLMEKANV